MDDREQARQQLWQQTYDHARAEGASDDFARLAATQALRRAEADHDPEATLEFDVDPYF